MVDVLSEQGTEVYTKGLFLSQQFSINILTYFFTIKAFTMSIFLYVEYIISSSVSSSHLTYKIQVG